MNHPLFAFINSPSQLLVVAILILILFGAKKLPTFARSLGRSLGEFKKARDEFEKEMHSAADDVNDDYKKPAEPRIEAPKQSSEAPKEPVPVGSAKSQ